MGMQFGHLKLTGNSRNGKYKEHEAVCVCGRTTWARYCNLSNGTAKSCGCMHPACSSKRGSWDAAKIIRIKQLLAEGWTFQQIADEYKVKYNGMRQIIWRFKLTARPVVVLPDAALRGEFDALFNRYYKQGWEYARRLVRNDDLADEAIALVGSTLWEKFATHRQGEQFWKAMKGFMYFSCKHVSEFSDKAINAGFLEWNNLEQHGESEEEDSTSPSSWLMTIYWGEVHRHRRARSKNTILSLHSYYGCKPVATLS